jgi:hypothetical protein
MLEELTPTSTNSSSINDVSSRKRGLDWKWSPEEYALLIMAAEKNDPVESVIPSFREIFGNKRSVNAISVRYSKELSRLKRKRICEQLLRPPVESTTENAGRTRYIVQQKQYGVVSSSIIDPSSSPAVPIICCSSRAKITASLKQLVSEMEIIDKSDLALLLKQELYDNRTLKLNQILNNK